MVVRKYMSSDCEYLAELFYQTVHSINARDYTKEQLNVWATGMVNLSEWNKSLSEHFTIVVLENDMIVGFGDIDKTGYLDRLYVHKDYQNQGIGTIICDNLEKAVEMDKIITHASITAKNFFIRRGYKVMKEQQVRRNGIFLRNYVMKKEINSNVKSGRKRDL